MFDHQAPFTHAAARLARRPARSPRAQLTTASGKRAAAQSGSPKPQGARGHAGGHSWDGRFRRGAAKPAHTCCDAAIAANGFPQNCFEAVPRLSFWLA